MRELLKRRAKERRANDRVGLLRDDQLAISSDQEEEFTTSIDQDTTTVRVGYFWMHGLWVGVVLDSFNNRGRCQNVAMA